MGDKIQEWILKLLRGLLPAARRDPVAASLCVLILIFEIATLSEWQYWGISFTPWDFVGLFLLGLMLWRLHRRSWSEGVLALPLAIALLAITIFFAYRVPFRRLSITLAETVVTLVLVVRFHP